MGNNRRGQGIHAAERHEEQEQSRMAFQQQYEVEHLLSVPCKECKGEGKTTASQCIKCRGSGRDLKHPKLPCPKCNGQTNTTLACGGCGGTGKQRLDLM